MQKALETKRLTLSYGGTIIIDELNLEIPKGEITIFIGSNGSGKSTLLRSLARLIKKKTGENLLDNKEIKRKEKKKSDRQMEIKKKGKKEKEGIKVLKNVKKGRYP
ncbi:ABC transporter ATP-binding protein, partial [Bacillus mycoides]|uniref:ABC transporter ATP-binding protein n=1 Tax=Bacillus mycoides TaxID=1405 RepID=UPI00284E9F83